MDAGLKYNVFIHIPSEEGMVLNSYEKKIEIPFYASRNCNTVVSWSNGSVVPNLNFQKCQKIF